MTRALIIGGALVIAFVAGFLARGPLVKPFDDAAFSRAYAKCTDRIDAEYQAKVDAEFAHERRQWAAKYPGIGQLTAPSLMLHERSDYSAFTERRVNCAEEARRALPR